MFLFNFKLLDRNKIITELYNSADINNAIGKMNRVELQDDLKQEVFMVLCEMEDEKLFTMYQEGYLKYFIVRTDRKSTRLNSSH